MTPANFDRIARPYRWMEYLTFGTALWHCRTHFLPQLQNSRTALVLGDGDGRFTAALLTANPHLHIDAVDSSSAMLRLLAQRAHATTLDGSVRLRIHHSDILAFAYSLPADARYDLVVTNFLLDCLTQSQVESLAQVLAQHLRPGALWLVSEFQIPAGAIHLPARVLIRSLYLSFRVLTGLRTIHLPDHTTSLRAAGFTCAAQHLSLFGILASELWTRARLHANGVHS